MNVVVLYESMTGNTQRAAEEDVARQAAAANWQPAPERAVPPCPVSCANAGRVP